jgi:hypothetical protein
VCRSERIRIFTVENLLGIDRLGQRRQPVPDRVDADLRTVPTVRADI